MMPSSRTSLRSVLLLVAIAIGCGDSPTTPSSMGGGSSAAGGTSTSVPNIAGRYNYESDAATMRCSNGTSVPLPAVSDTLTITQSGNRFDGELSIEPTVPVPGDASFFDDCIINPDSTYACDGEYRDSNAVVTFDGGGRFSGSGFTGTTNLRMAMADGTVCTWAKQERGTRIS